MDFYVLYTFMCLLLLINLYFCFNSYRRDISFKYRYLNDKYNFNRSNRMFIFFNFIALAYIIFVLTFLLIWV